MVHVLVVPLDGSEFAERALRPACAFAAQLENARVVLLSCTWGDGRRVRAHLDDRAAMFDGVVDVETRIVADVEPTEAIVETVASMPDALLCMATHGRSGLRTAVFGSVAEQVVCRSSRPLVLVGPACRTVLLPGERGRLLVCSDGSHFSDAVVPAAASWGHRLHLDPWVAEVVVPDEAVVYPGQPLGSREIEAASARLDGLAARLGASTLSARTEVLHGTPVSRSIADFAVRLPAGLIAMATHGRTGLVRSAMGSVAAEVVRRAPCPVLVARPGASEDPHVTKESADD